ncbi:MAG: lipoate--protein ligase family protein [Candidatus Aenigmarchaeota archaeon]|nr:lipoate--protein ligase family protein [Candidatus Aenigmarchaeota archaeon]
MEGRIITLESTSIAEYMAISETLQESVGRGYPVTIFLASGWQRKGVSIGERQKIGYVNLEACREDSLEVVRRPTEGYAVIHNVDDVAYGIVIPKQHVRSKRDLDSRLFPIVVRSLERVGVPNGYDPFPEGYGNIFVNGRKISGSAQNTVTPNGQTWLQHGIIAMRRHDAGDYVRYTNGERDVVKMQAQMTSVEEEGGIADSNKLVLAMAEEFVRQLLEFGIEMKSSSLSKEELGYAEKLVRAKYEDEEWLLSGTGNLDKSERVECFVGWKN